MPSTTPTAGSRVKAANTPAPYFMNAAASAPVTVTTTSPTDVTGATITFTTVQANASVLVIGVFDMLTVSSGATALGTCIVDGSGTFGEAIHFLGATGARETVVQQWPITGLAAGSHTIKLQAMLSAASGSCTIGSTHTTITATVYDW
jgi:hypothetical protein